MTSTNSAEAQRLDHRFADTLKPSRVCRRHPAINLGSQDFGENAVGRRFIFFASEKECTREGGADVLGLRVDS